MALVKRLDRHHRVWAIPFQQPGAPAVVGITYADAEQAAWAIDARRTRYRGAGAIDAALAYALGWPWLLRLDEIPALRRWQDAVYAWVARNRSHFPGFTPYCQQYPQKCAPQGEDNA